MKNEENNEKYVEWNINEMKKKTAGESVAIEMKNESVKTENKWRKWKRRKRGVKNQRNGGVAMNENGVISKSNESWQQSAAIMEK